MTEEPKLKIECNLNSIEAKRLVKSNDLAIFLWDIDNEFVSFILNLKERKLISNKAKYLIIDKIQQLKEDRNLITEDLTV